MFWEREVLNFNNTPVEFATNEDIVKYWYDRGYLCLVEDKRAKKMVYIYKDPSFRGVRGLYSIDQMNCQDRARHIKLAFRILGKSDFASTERRLRRK